nr:MAG TPA: hypothetical protein [Caudoviricetes sp.]DAM99025.1 MAG TPA: hypothetical protein [Caudoviricetes sp.]
MIYSFPFSEFLIKSTKIANKYTIYYLTFFCYF